MQCVKLSRALGTSPAGSQDSFVIILAAYHKQRQEGTGFWVEKMYDSYLALPDKLLIWFYQENIFSQVLFIPPSLALPLSFLPYHLSSPPSLSPSCVCSFSFSCALSLACTLPLFHFCSSSLTPRSSSVTPSPSFTSSLFLALACASSWCALLLSSSPYVVWLTVIPICWFSVYFDYISN